MMMSSIAVFSRYKNDYQEERESCFSDPDWVEKFRVRCSQWSWDMRPHADDYG
jgi:hypothetical protein